MLVDSLVSSCISNAGLQDKQLEPAIDGGVQQETLDELNLLFDSWRSYIPYASVFNFTNYEQLKNTRFVSVDMVSFVFPGKTVQQPLRPVDLTKWVELTSIINLSGIPQIYYFDPQYQTILVYPVPAVPNYAFTVWGRPAIGPLALGQELPPQVPNFMIDALQYEGGFRMASKYRVEWSPELEKLRGESYNTLKSQRVIALSPRINTVFKARNSSGSFPFLYFASGGRA